MPNCNKCGKKIDRRTKTGLCATHYYQTEYFINHNKRISQKGPNHQCYKGGRGNCEKCGKALGSYKNSRTSNMCPSCSKKGKKNPLVSGPLHPFWKGGISPLSVRIRNSYKSEEWRRSIFGRDNFTCQICGCRNGDGKKHIHQAHHIIPFEHIFRNFITAHNSYSPLEDTKILLKLSEEYSPFWDISNGVTLCVPCHKLRDRKQVDYKFLNSKVEVCH